MGKTKTHIEEQIMPRVVAFFHEYRPQFDVCAVVSRMLRTVPPEYLVGLDSVVLTSMDTLSNQRRKSGTKSRRRTVRVAQTLGLYHHAHQGEGAWIEIFVDRVLARWEKGFWLKVPLIRDLLLAPVLFHEIGHHIHANFRPEFREREDVADNWKVKLETIYYKKERPSIGVMAFLAKPFRRMIHKAVTSKLATGRKIR
jgi:hypothetical protein